MRCSRLVLAVSLTVAFSAVAAGPAAGEDPAPRLVGATEVDPPGKYPFAVALVDRHLADAWRGRFCDGALVADRFVLTAARCLEDRRVGEVDVVVGRHDLSAGGGRRVHAVAFHFHPLHDGADLYDAALVELEAAVPFRPVTLPSVDASAGPAVVVGWGDTLEPDRLPRALQQAGPDLLPDADCVRIYGAGFSAASMVCAGDLRQGGVGACAGDRGAPLFVERPTGRVQVGIAGWGVGCGLPGFPALYTRVAAVAPWVQSVTRTGPFACAGRAPTHLGTQGADVLTGSPGDDVIMGLGGSDVIDGGGGNDLICAGSGDDRVTGGEGDDVIHGEGGDDTLRGGPGNDTLYGGGGDDRLEGEGGGDRLDGGEGNDLLSGGPGRDRLYGGPGRDVLAGNGGRDFLAGGGGADHLIGGPGLDLLYGGPGPDRLLGRSGADRLFGGSGEDLLFGGPQDDLLRGGPGADVLSGGLGDDILHGEGGDDTLRGGPGDDVLVGGDGFDRGSGGPGRDACLLESAGACEI
ncbi:MAG: trypsin-like serine protease [Actinobacteria bacterium]|nr:trypsin-like serine protease [Actinomycetota bacterium]